MTGDIPKGRLRDLLHLFFPLLLVTFSNTLFLLVEKVLLARLSSQAMGAAVTAAYAYQIFQGACVALAMMAQVGVARSYGEKALKKIGPEIWQFLWFSFLSILIVIPFGAYYAGLYFRGTEIESIVLPYYNLFLFFNFLFPLGATLSCFYLGRGKTQLVLWASLVSQAIKLLLSYALIFGVEGWIPSFGLVGGALSTLIAQAVLCLLLLSVFLNRKHRELYDTHKWAFQGRLFWESIYPGLLRVGNRLLGLIAWASIAYLMTRKGGDYLLFLSIGGTLFLFLPFLADALCQAQVTIASQLASLKEELLLKRAFYNAALLGAIISLLVALPLIAFPQITFHLLFPTLTLELSVIKNLFLGVWVSFVFYLLAFIPISYILAFKDMKFSLFMGFISWINGYLLMYVALEYIGIKAESFWLTLSLFHGSTALLYFWRSARLIHWRLLPLKLPQS